MIKFHTIFIQFHISASLWHVCEFTGCLQFKAVFPWLTIVLQFHKTDLTSVEEKKNVHQLFGINLLGNVYFFNPWSVGSDLMETFEFCSSSCCFCLVSII